MTEYSFYQIECNGKRYVGHTTNFNQRKLKHEYNCGNDKDSHYDLPLYQYIRANGNWDSCQMLILEILNLETKRDAESREEYWRIEKDATLNGCRCYLTPQQRNIDKYESNKLWVNINKDKVKKYSKDAFQRNKEKIYKYRKDKRQQIKLKKQMLNELLKNISYCSNYSSC